MARTKMTAEQIAARTAKAKATKAAKKAAAMELLGVEKRPVKKIRKKRQLTEAQKQAAIDRLAKARAARGPSENKQIDEYVRNLPDDNPLSLKNVRQWIKDNKELLSAIRSFKDSKESSERAKYSQVYSYVQNLESYLRTGMYTDLFYGSGMQNRIKYKCVAMAYYKDGTPKRTVGVLYPDVGVYTQEMADMDNDRRTISNKNKIHKNGRARSNI